MANSPPNQCDIWIERLDAYKETDEGRDFITDGAATEVFNAHRKEIQGLFARLEMPFTEVTFRTFLKRPKLYNIFGILLYVQSHDNALRQFARFLPHGDSEPQILEDVYFPFDKSKCDEWFPIDGQRGNFYETQFKFSCATIVEKKHLAFEYHPQMRLPYLEQTLIGSGAYGEVFRVKIAKGHFVLERGCSITTKDVEYARKDFTLRDGEDRRFEEEIQILNELREQSMKHASILLAKFSVEINSQNLKTYSLFSDLADGGDLDQYLTQFESSLELDHLLRYYVFHQTSKIAGALAHLHGNLCDLRGDTVRCYHLDLKPKNILVFGADDPSRMRWKIADFGVARFRGRRQDNVRWPLDNIFRPQSGYQSTERRRDGTYLAPENKMTAESDVWALGCIISVVLSFLVGGKSSIEDFSRHRSHKRNDDYFYQETRLRTILAPPVKRWFKALLRQSAHSEILKTVVKRTTKLLRKRILVPKPSKRITAADLEKELLKISRVFITPSSLPLTGCTFSPRGDFLAFYSAQEIRVFTTQYLRSAVQSGNTQFEASLSFNPPTGEWEFCSVSSTYLAASVHNSIFKVHLYLIGGQATSTAEEASSIASEGSSKLLSVVGDTHVGKIVHLTLSGAGAFTACVARINNSPDSTDFEVYLLHTARLLVPLKGSIQDLNIIKADAGRSLMGFDDVDKWSLAFSRDDKTLTLIAERPSSKLLSLMAWDTETGLRKCRPVNLTVNKDPESRDRLFTKCVSSGMRPDLLIISERGNMIHLSDWTNTGTITNTPVNIRVHTALFSGINEVIIIGKDGSKLCVYTSNPTGSDFQEITQIMLDNFQEPRSCAVLLDTDNLEQKQLYIASIRTSRSEPMFLPVDLH